ncbi:ribonuclease h2 subunit b [Anaeramoeba flamelloides]|uniref:Ribonuclease h2 subunit b n=1 Tax=Anaeramoeba flamelloides TaxID=1746091 RepID=A0AAV7ZDU2_9EUKA|nr:ribonuclease h2 subunit b [Anaeramoeba flamelloides]
MSSSKKKILLVSACNLNFFLSSHQTIFKIINNFFSSSICFFFLLLNDLDQKNEWDSSMMFNFENKAGEQGVYVFLTNGTILEIFKHSRPPRSFFLADYVQQDGNLFVTTKIDPTFLVLRILETKFCTKFSKDPIQFSYQEFLASHYILPKLEKKINLLKSLHFLCAIDQGNTNKKEIENEKENEKEKEKGEETEKEKEKEKEKNQDLIIEDKTKRIFILNEELVISWLEKKILRITNVILKMEKADQDRFVLTGGVKKISEKKKKVGLLKFFQVFEYGSKEDKIILEEGITERSAKQFTYNLIMDYTNNRWSDLLKIQLGLKKEEVDDEKEKEKEKEKTKTKTKAKRKRKTKPKSKSKSKTKTKPKTKTKTTKKTTKRKYTRKQTNSAHTRKKKRTTKK